MLVVCPVPAPIPLCEVVLLKQFIESEDGGNRRAPVRSVHTAVHSGLQDEQLHKCVLVHPNVTNDRERPSMSVELLLSAAMPM